MIQQMSDKVIKAEVMQWMARSINSINIYEKTVKTTEELALMQQWEDYMGGF